MSVPKGKDRKKEFLTNCIIVAAVTAAVLLISMHIPFAAEENSGIDGMINGAVVHMLKNPFEVSVNRDYTAIILFAAMIILLYMYTCYLRDRQLRPGIENGSAKWNTNLNAYNKKYTSPKGSAAIDKSTGDWTQDKKGRWIPPNQNMIFTNDVYLSMSGRDTMRNCNALVVGGSGSGKSRFLVKPNLLQANCSYVITDPSGELLETMGDFLQNKGYDIKVLNLVEMDCSSRYNPFHYIRNEEGVLSMINALIANTTPKEAMKGDPFWEKSETALLLAICYFLWYEVNEKDQNFGSIMKLLRCAEIRDGNDDYVSPLDQIFADLEAKNPEHIAVRQYKVFKSAGSGKTAQSILICAMTRLNVFDIRALTELTNVDEMHLEDIGDKPTALFCITPVADTTFNFVVSLMYTQLFETLYHHAETECKGKRLPIHVRFMLDEFANIGSIPEFSEKLATMRKYDISCTIILQTVSQLKTRYKDDYETIIGNCDSFLFLGGQEQSTLELVSKKLGKETIKTKNSSRNIGNPRQRGGNLSYNTTGRELMMPDEIAKIDTSDCIFFLRGEDPFFGKKYDYPKHPNYYLTGDAEDEYLYDVHEHKRETEEIEYTEEETEEGIYAEPEAEIPEIEEVEEIPDMDFNTVDAGGFLINDTEEW